MSKSVQRKITAAFIASASITCSAAQAAPSDPQPTSSRPAQSDDQYEMAKRLYQAQLKQAFLKDPHLYKSLANVVSSPNQATTLNEAVALEARKRDEAEARNSDSLKASIGLPLSQITGLSVNASHEFFDKEKGGLLLIRNTHVSAKRCLPTWQQMTEMPNSTG